MEDKNTKAERIAEYFKVFSGNTTVRDDLQKVMDSYKKAYQREMPDENTLYLLAIAPALVSFVNWVLDDAEARGKNRLYFLSRDGYQMYLIARRMVQLRGLSIECRYLSVSRYSMRMPGYFLKIEDSIGSICVGGIDVTAEKILKRGGLKDDECHQVMDELGLLNEKDKILNYHQVQNLKKQLEQSDLLRGFIYKHSAEMYEEAIAYLKQEGLTADGKYAIVDSGWIGTLQLSMEKLVRSVAPGIEVEGYYFGMYEYPAQASKDKFHAYYFGPGEGLSRKAGFSNSLFEAIVSAEEGMAMGYQIADAGYVPVYKSQVNPNAAQIKGNITVLNMLLSKIGNVSEWRKNDRNMIQKLFTLFMANPTDYEVSAYGGNRFSDDVMDGCYKSVAAELSYEQIKDQWFINKLLIIAGMKKATIHESAWMEGSAVKCGVWVKRNIRHIRGYKYLVYARKQIKSQGLAVGRLTNGSA